MTTPNADDTSPRWSDEELEILRSRARALALRKEGTEDAEATDAYLLVEADGELLAVPLSGLGLLTEQQALAYLPGAPPEVLGIGVAGGAAVTAVWPGARPRESAPECGLLCVALLRGHPGWALAADRFVGIRRLPPDTATQTVDGRPCRVVEPSRLLPA
ncbi:MAG: hypothetical protein RJQ04_14915, partial [Longimicrobiales bacterium]